MELKDLMKERREVLSLTQQDLAEMAQVGVATVKDIERGQGNPSLSTIKKILDVLGIEIEYRVKLSQRSELQVMKYETKYIER